jgi:hypothetical protein
VKDLTQDVIPGPSFGCRQELDKLQQAESIIRTTPKSINNIKKPGPEGDLLVTHGQIDSLARDWFTEAIFGLWDFFSGSKPDQEVMVREYRLKLMQILN